MLHSFSLLNFSKQNLFKNKSLQMSSWLDKHFLEPQAFIQLLINTCMKSVAEH